MLERLIAAVVALLIVLPTIIYGGVIGFFVLGVVIVLIGTQELWNMFQAKYSFPAQLRWFLHFVYVTVFVSMFIWPSASMAIIMVALLVLWLIGLFGVPDTDLGNIWASVSTFGLMYLPFLMNTFVQVRSIPDTGLYWLFWTMVLTWSADTGAYFAGRFLGKHKLFPRVSPKKTIEGVVGGVLLSAVVSVVFCINWLPMVTMPYAVGFGVLLAGLSVVGDLVESMMKRSFGVKDSGTIMPGHGGVIDRLDSLLFTFPSTWLIVHLVYGLV